MVIGSENVKTFESFTHNDVEALKFAPSEDTKLGLIRKLHHNFHLDKLTANEKLIAEEILRFLAADMSVRIRQSISTNFCDNLALPHDIALTLANDLEDIVAVPIIEHSQTLEEKDLINIIEQGKATRQKAVAQRGHLTDNLCAHIIYRTSQEVVAALVNNKKNNLSEGNSEIMIKNHSKNPLLMRLMITNKKITLEQAYGLLANVSDDLQKMLIVEYNIPSTVVNNLVHDSREWMVLNMILTHQENPDEVELNKMIEKLYTERELSFSILVKSLSLGNLRFFEASMAKLAALPLDNVHKLLSDHSNQQGFKALYTKCMLPESMSEAIYKLMLIVTEEKLHEAPEVSKIHHRILNRLSRVSNSERITNLDYLVTIVAYNLKKSNLL